jgi:hypothetical protein
MVIFVLKSDKKFNQKDEHESTIDENEDEYKGNEDYIPVPICKKHRLVHCDRTHSLYHCVKPIESIIPCTLVGLNSNKERQFSCREKEE